MRDWGATMSSRCRAGTAVTRVTLAGSVQCSSKRRGCGAETSCEASRIVLCSVQQKRAVATCEGCLQTAGAERNTSSESVAPGPRDKSSCSAATACRRPSRLFDAQLVH